MLFWLSISSTWGRYWVGRKTAIRFESLSSYSRTFAYLGACLFCLISSVKAAFCATMLSLSVTLIPLCNVCFLLAAKPPPARF